MACQNCTAELRHFARRLASHPQVTSKTFFPKPRTPFVQSRRISQTVHRQNESRNAPKDQDGPGKAPGVLGGLASGLLGRLQTPYIVLHGTEKMYKTCSAPAMYSIPEEDRKMDRVKKTEDGEEIGIAEGPWLTGMNCVTGFLPMPTSILTLPLYRPWPLAILQHLVTCYDATHVPDYSATAMYGT
jgi:hypothetical protein